MSHHQINQNKLTIKENSESKYKNSKSKLYSQLNGKSDMSSNIINDKNTNELIEWLQNCYQIRNKWNNLQVKFKKKK